MTKSFLIIFFIGISISVFSQENGNTQNAFDFINLKIQKAISQDSIRLFPLIIVDGYLLSTEKEIKHLELLDYSAIKNVTMMSAQKAQLQFDGEKAINGIVLITLYRKESRRWKRLLKSMN